MSGGLFSISGLASGLDTSQLVQDLMQVERIPVVQMEARQKTFQQKLDAWGSVTTRVSALRSSIDSLKDLRDLTALTTASSSDEAAVGVKVTGEPSTGNLSFSVDQLAGNQQSLSQGSFADANGLVGAGSFELTLGGETRTITTTATTTVGQLASSINALDAGVSAQVVKVGAGDHRLMLSGQETGVANAFSISSTAAGVTAFDQLQAAKDALLTLGSGAGAVQIARSSNTVDDLVRGVELDLNATTGSQVAIQIERDLDGAVETVQGLVDELNATIAKVRDLSKYNGEDAAAGPLLGDSTARKLVGDLQSAMSGVVAGLSGSRNFAGSVGITLTSDGTYTVDTDVLRGAFEDDFQATAELFGRAGTATDDRVSFARAGDDTAVQSHTVAITRAAAVASATGAAYTVPATDPQPFTITAGDGTVVTVAIASGDSVAAAVTKINAAIAAAGVSDIHASSETQGSEDHIQLATSGYGAAATFTVADDPWGMAGTHTGVDVAGTINGVAAVGSGQALTGADGSAADGLVLAVRASQSEVDAAGGSLDLGSVNYTTGLVGALSSVLDRAEGTDGDIARAKDLWQDRIDLYDERIERFEIRLEQREITLRRQFTAMETAMSSLQSQGNWLSTQLASMFG